MPRKRTRKSHRHISPLKHLWQSWRMYWLPKPKDEFIFGTVLALIVVTFVYFMYSAISRRDDLKNLTCLALNVYFEARGESDAGQYAVAEVTMNRVASPRFPNSVCAVVHQKRWDPLRKRYVSAFSWNELDEKPSLEDETYRRAWEVAEAVYYGRHTPMLSGALHFHAVYIKKPSWARQSEPIARIGKHVFYK